MENLNITQLEKRIKILLEWKSVLLCLAEDELSPYDKQCAEKELSHEVNILSRIFVCYITYDCILIKVTSMSKNH
ncbi:hypothetical protein A9Z39_10145 [Paenibacillus polymyxa]|nr:hypothetical protein A9Z39_10145 [Paenibacillus polymyxa]